MNIMKTNMLLLDNRIRKDDGDKTTTVAAPASTTVQPQAGMKALMFQGMQNLMANPALAKEVGVMNGGEENSAAPKNIAFQGKLKTLALASMVALSGAMALSSCDDKEYISVPAATYENKTIINIDLSAMTTMVGMLQSTLTQMLAQQQLSYEQFQKYMEQTAAWQQRMEQKVGTLEAILADMGTQLFNIDNHVVGGFSETNALQKIVIDRLSQFMTRDEAIAYFNKLCVEISKAAESGNDAEFKAAITDAVNKIFEQLKLVNQNLDTIISNQDRDYALQQESYEILKDIKGDTKAMRAAAEFAANQLVTVNNSIVDGNNKVVASIAKLDGDMKAGIAYVAQTVGWSTEQVIAFMNKMGIDIKNREEWTASMIIAAINYNTAVTKQGNEEIAKLRADFNAYKLTAEEYAQKLLDVVNDLNSKVGVLVEDFNSYANDMKKAANTAINELKFGNITAMQTNGLLVNVLMNQQKAYGLFKVMNQNIEKLDVDLNAGVDKLAEGLQCSTEEVLGMMRWLGFTDAQTKAMSTAAIINAIKGASNKAIFVLGDKLNQIVDKVGTCDNNLTQEEKDTIIALLSSINQGVENNGNKIDELKELVKDLIAKVEAYAESALTALNGQSETLNKIKSEFRYLQYKLNALINYANTAEQQRAAALEEINKLKLQLNQIIAKVDGLVTPQDLADILDVKMQELLAKLQVNPADYSTIEELLADIDAKMEYQATSNKLLLELLEAVKKLDKNDPDYTAKLNRIIELMENFKFECNCKCDCDGNTNIVDEGENILN